MKKYLMFVCLILGLAIIPILAYADGTTNSKTDTLNKLTILQGDGTDFNLTGQLKRSEAITFLIRILGKENFVLENQSKYQTSTFSDVKSNDWFAPYVGYSVEQSIVNGFPDGKFHPNDSISEKAFLKLVLGALGYKTETDFTWSNLYSFALSKGIVSDAKYQNQTKDNTVYTRSDVINVLYTSLNILGKSNTSIIDTLLSEKIIDRKLLVQIGLVKETISTTLTVSEPLTETSLNLKFNEGAANIGIKDILVYETGSKANVLTASIDKQDDQVITLKTAAQKPGQSYTVEVSNIVNKDNIAYPNLTTTFNGFIPIKIVSVTVSSANKLVINFNKVVKTIPVSAIKINEKDNGANLLTFSIESQTDKSIVLSTSAQKELLQYSLNFTGIEEAIGNLVTLNTDFMGYKNPEITSDFFKISKVLAVNTNVINVYYTQPVNGIAALPIYYEIFQDNVSYIKGTFSNMSAKQLPNQSMVISLYLKDKPISANAVYKVVISGDVSSYDGVRLNDGAGDSALFSGSSNPVTGLFATSVIPVDNNTVRVEFSREIDPVSVQQIANYNVTSLGGVTSAVVRAIVPKDGIGKSLLLQIGGMFDGNTDYQLVIKNVADQFTVNTLTETKLLFTGRNLPVRKDTKILYATALDNRSIQVYFDKNLTDGMTQTTFYYTITGISNTGYTTIPTTVYFDIKDAKKVILSLPAGKEISNNNSYKLTVSYLMPDELNNISVANAEYTFIGSAETNVKPYITEAKIIGKDIIRIKTNKVIQATGGNILASNYFLEYKDTTNTLITRTVTSVTAIDGNTIILRCDALDLSKNYTLRFTSLTDFSGSNIRSAIDGSNSIGVTLGK